MFGHQNNNPSGGMATDPDASLMLGSHEPETIAPNGPPVSAVPGPAPTNDYVMTDLPHIAAPAHMAPTSLPTSAPVGSPAVGLAMPASAPSPAVTPGNDSAAPNDLIELKQSALHELSPLVGHLDQTAEEKFRTTMMMIQATDDQSLLPTAFQAAKDIADEKARAQALLDVINEINYFTQQQSDVK